MEKFADTSSFTHLLAPTSNIVHPPVTRVIDEEEPTEETEKSTASEDKMEVDGGFVEPEPNIVSSVVAEVPEEDTDSDRYKDSKHTKAVWQWGKSDPVADVGQGKKIKTLGWIKEFGKE